MLLDVKKHNELRLKIKQELLAVFDKNTGVPIDNDDTRYGNAYYAGVEAICDAHFICLGALIETVCKGDLEKGLSYIVSVYSEMAENMCKAYRAKTRGSDVV